ncbi:SIR2 family protein [Fulvivirga ligni]|uniref:SIR2 family protein n=1 Tax=Fulvivirga ligni TaxID=2904246 RepID=UPI0021045EE2|nr:SIR2 family protein [Fulvivirga ligni]
MGAGAKEKFPDSELVIYPSKDKYESSRKQPFTSYFDRLKEFLLGGEGIFIISGYSFSDDHINEVLYNALNQNNRLHIIAFFFDDAPQKKIVKSGRNFPNFTLISPSEASISGRSGKWAKNSKGKILEPYWNKETNKLELGDFKKMVDFLIFCTGMREVKE